MGKVAKAVTSIALFMGLAISPSAHGQSASTIPEGGIHVAFKPTGNLRRDLSGKVVASGPVNGCILGAMGAAYPNFKYASEVALMDPDISILRQFAVRAGYGNSQILTLKDLLLYIGIRNTLQNLGITKIEWLQATTSLMPECTIVVAYVADSSSTLSGLYSELFAVTPQDDAEKTQHALVGIMDLAKKYEEGAREFYQATPPKHGMVALRLQPYAGAFLPSGEQICITEPVDQDVLRWLMTSNDPNVTAFRLKLKVNKISDLESIFQSAGKDCDFFYGSSTEAAKLTDALKREHRLFMTLPFFISDERLGEATRAIGQIRDEARLAAEKKAVEQEAFEAEQRKKDEQRRVLAEREAAEQLVRDEESRRGQIIEQRKIWDKAASEPANIRRTAIYSCAKSAEDWSFVMDNRPDDISCENITYPFNQGWTVFWQHLNRADLIKPTLMSFEHDTIEGGVMFLKPIPAAQTKTGGDPTAPLSISSMGVDENPLLRCVRRAFQTALI